jgi:hypothetical protein
MSTILRKGVIQGGQVVVAEPIDLPDGSGVSILGSEDNGVPPTDEESESIDFMTEEEQSDDPELIEQWVDDLRSIPPVPENPAKEAEWRAWEETMRQFNIEAVRKQFGEGTP